MSKKLTKWQIRDRDPERIMAVGRFAIKHCPQCREMCLNAYCDSRDGLTSNCPCDSCRKRFKK